MPTERRYTGVEPHGTGWRGVYRVSGVRHRTHTYPTKREAFQARTMALAEARNGLHVDRRRSNLTVRQWFTVWQPERRVRAITASHDANRWRLHIDPYLGEQRLDAVTPFLLDKWMKWLDDNGRSADTQHKAHTLLRTALEAAISDKRIVVNPCNAVKPPRVVRPEWKQMTRDHFEAVFSHMRCDRDRAVMLLGAYAGLRWSEMVALRRCDYNPLKGTLTVSRGLVQPRGMGPQINAPKSGKPREIPLHPRLREALDLLAVDTDPAGLLLTTRTGAHLTPSNWRARVWEPAIANAGVEHYRIHDTRHAFASWLLQGGMDLGQVRDLLGHASITTTQKYIHSDPDKMREGLLRAFG
jgi:integrase